MEAEYKAKESIAQRIRETISLLNTMVAEARALNLLVEVSGVGRYEQGQDGKLKCTVSERVEY